MLLWIRSNELVVKGISTYEHFDLAIKEGFSPTDDKKCQRAFDYIWTQSVKNAKPILEPSVYILGGQPGAGKSDLFKLTE